MTESFIPPYPDAVAREKKIAFVTCALIGLEESARWVRDPELTRLVVAARGRALDLLRVCQAEVEPGEVRHAG